MAGCFGNNPEDRMRERELDKYLSDTYENLDCPVCDRNLPDTKFIDSCICQDCEPQGTYSLDGNSWVNEDGVVFYL